MSAAASTSASVRAIVPAGPQEPGCSDRCHHRGERQRRPQDALPEQKAHARQQRAWAQPRRPILRFPGGITTFAIAAAFAARAHE